MATQSAIQQAHDTIEKIRAKYGESKHTPMIYKGREEYKPDAQRAFKKAPGDKAYKLLELREDQNLIGLLAQNKHSRKQYIYLYTRDTLIFQGRIEINYPEWYNKESTRTVILKTSIQSR